jgi:Bacteriophage CI repressor helix-turn-helix domain
MKHVNPFREEKGNSSEAAQDVHRLLDRMCEALGVTDHAALALALRRDERTTRVWRSRGRIPPAVLMEVVAKSGKSLQWLTAADGHALRENVPVFHVKNEKQVNPQSPLTKDEEALIQEWRRAAPAVRQAIVTLMRSAAKDKPQR